jgi:hypothetical protein
MCEVLVIAALCVIGAMRLGPAETFACSFSVIAGWIAVRIGNEVLERRRRAAERARARAERRRDWGPWQ